MAEVGYSAEALVSPKRSELLTVSTVFASRPNKGPWRASVITRTPRSIRASRSSNGAAGVPARHKLEISMAAAQDILARAFRSVPVLREFYARASIEAFYQDSQNTQAQSKRTGALTHLGANFDLSIVVISFNTREMTLECLRSIQIETREIRYEIIVVDNNSADGSVEAIRSEFPHVCLVALKENIGFARANNLAAKKARGGRLLLLNPDTVILDRAIDRLLVFANSTSACGIWGGRTVFRDGSLNPSGWRRISLWNLTCYAFLLTHLAPNSPILSAESYGGWKRDSVRHVDIVSGCLFLVDRTLWEQLGGFNPIFFMYGEEADFCLRARLIGARPIMTPAATIVHYGRASAVSSLERLVTLFKGKATIMNLHWSPTARFLGRRIFLVAPLVRWSMYWLAGHLLGRTDFKSLAKEWRALWQRRGDWINGYP
jgi:GT2 family glycosyltransferase